MSSLKELLEEFRDLFSGKGARLLDSLLPLLVFVVSNPLVGLKVAVWGAIAIAGILAITRILQRGNLVYALGGLGGVLLAAVFASISGSETGFFVPGLISGAVTVVLCVVSVTLNRPLAAWTSSLTRRWPRGWYWHPNVLPAYNEVTMMWALAFAVRLALEFWLFRQDAAQALGVSRIVLGWPYTVVLLVVSYLYGLWRLGKLKGPSIEEFKKEIQPPWEGQKRGF